MRNPPFAGLALVFSASLGAGLGAPVNPLWAGVGAVVGVILAAILTPPKKR